jgi:hypothetical protein
MHAGRNVDAIWGTSTEPYWRQAETLQRVRDDRWRKSVMPFGSFCFRDYRRFQRLYRSISRRTASTAVFGDMKYIFHTYRGLVWKCTSCHRRLNRQEGALGAAENAERWRRRCYASNKACHPGRRDSGEPGSQQETRAYVVYFAAHVFPGSPMTRCRASRG